MDPNKKFGAAEIIALFKKYDKELCDLQYYIEQCCSKVPINIGSGFGLYKKLHNGKWEFKSLSAGSNINITDNGYDLTISGTAQPLDCDDIKDCIGISPSGDPNKYLNEQGDWQTITVPISTVGDTATVNLTVTGTTLTADFASMNISQFTNDSGYGTGTVTNVAATVPVVTNPFLSVNVPNPNTTPSVDLTANGLVSQYVRGDGSLANFPSSTGGGASVSYYLNGSVNQGSFTNPTPPPPSLTFYQMSKVPVIGIGTDFNISANGYIAQFITNVGDPSLLNIPAGNWLFDLFFSSSSSGGSPNFYVELHKWDGAVFTLIASSSATPESITNGTAIDLYTTALAVPATTLTLTERLAVRVYVNHSGKTITLHTEDNHLCQIITTFTTGITALNGLTAQVQSFATGTTGTDFGISSSGSTHTFNIPTASALNRGLLSSADWSTFNSKVTSVGATSPITSSGGTTPTISTSMNTNKLIGRGSGGVGVMEEITLGTGLSLSGTTLNAATVTDTITFSADGGGGVITPGRSGGFWRCPYNCTITGWYLQEGTNTTSSCVIDTWKSNAFPPVVGNTIWSITNPKPSLTGATNNSSTLASPITVTAGEWIGFNIDSCTSATYLTLVLIVTKP